jgi:predicted aspartyl protease
MTWYYFLAALAAAAGINATVEQGAPPEMTDADVLAMERERYERMTVPVTIKGEGPFRFMIDTGAQATVLSTNLAEKLELTQRRRATLIGMASSRSVETTRIPQFGIGTRTLTITTAPLVDSENIGGADGILGLDGLQGQRVLLDFVKQRMLVAEAGELGGNRGYEIIVRARRNLGQIIIANASLDDVKTAVIIDTGAQASVGNMALLQRLRRSRASGENTMTDINGEELKGQVRIGEKLSIGEMDLTNVPILFADTPPFSALGFADQPALVLGMNELKLFRRVAIDFDKRQVLFDLPRGIRRQDATIGAIIG